MKLKEIKEIIEDTLFDCGEQFTTDRCSEIAEEIIQLIGNEDVSTCTANERKFLDRIQEKGKWETYKTGTGIKINRETKIMQKDFLPINLFELCKGASQ